MGIVFWSPSRWKGGKKTSSRGWLPIEFSINQSIKQSGTLTGTGGQTHSSALRHVFSGVSHGTMRSWEKDYRSPFTMGSGCRGTTTRFPFFRYMAEVGIVYTFVGLPVLVPIKTLMMMMMKNIEIGESPPPPAQPGGLQNGAYPNFRA